MKAKHRLFAGLLLCAHAFAANADFLFPAVATGGRMHAEFTLTTTGGAPLAGIPISLSVQNSCGTVSPTSISTDGSGVGRFDFVAGSSPGVCVIAGQNGSTVVLGRTTIYRASSVTLNISSSPVTEMAPGLRTTLTVVVRAGDATLYGIPISVGSPIALGVASATVASKAIVTDTAGRASFDVQGNGGIGFYDIPVQAAGVSRHLRIWQHPPAPRARERARVADVRDRPAWMPPATLSIEGGPASCVVTALYSSVSLTIPPPTGIAGFPDGEVRYFIDDCPAGSTVQLKLDNGRPLPASSQLWWDVLTGEDRWKMLPSSVAGNTITFTVVDEGLGDSGAPAKGPISGVVGVALPGPFLPRVYPRVQDMWWSGPEENGWGMSIAQSSEGALFSALYVYDAAGNPTWWVLPAGDWDPSTRRTFIGAAYSPYGTPWTAFDGAITVAGATVGPISLSFEGSDRATMSYAINGVSGQKTIRRQEFGPLQASPLSDVGGMWWGGQAQNGWGIAIMQQQATLFSVWFTYDDANLATWFVMPGGGWSTTDTYVGRIYRTRGSPWLGQVYNPALLQATDVGSFSIKFSGTDATFEYSLEGRTGTMPLVRQAPF